MTKCVIPNCPHHFHNHPTVRLRGHDQIREQMSAALIEVQAQILAAAVMHPGRLDDLLDSLPLIGKFLDAMRWESLDMIAYLHAQGVSQQEGMRMCAEIARTGDAEKLMAQGLELERRHPLPIVVRD